MVIKELDGLKTRERQAREAGRFMDANFGQSERIDGQSFEEDEEIRAKLDPHNTQKWSGDDRILACAIQCRDKFTPRGSVVIGLTHDRNLGVRIRMSNIPQETVPSLCHNIHLRRNGQQSYFDAFDPRENWWTLVIFLLGPFWISSWFSSGSYRIFLTEKRKDSSYSSSNLVYFSSAVFSSSFSIS